METKLLCADSDNQLIKSFSEALIKQGITEGAQFYYVDSNMHLPFFKIPKAFKKETPEDPSIHYVFVDVDEAQYEYTVCGNYVHEHISDEDRAAELEAKLLNAEIVEIAIVYPDRMAGFFVNNTGDPQANVDIIGKNFGEIKEHLEFNIYTLQGGHLHTLYTRAFPYYLQIGPTAARHKLPGISIYLVSSVLAEHPEFYIIQ